MDNNRRNYLERVAKEFLSKAGYPPIQETSWKKNCGKQKDLEIIFVDWHLFNSAVFHIDDDVFNSNDKVRVVEEHLSSGWFLCYQFIPLTVGEAFLEEL